MPLLGAAVNKAVEGEQGHRRHHGDQMADLRHWKILHVDMATGEGRSVFMVARIEEDGTLVVASICVTATNIGDAVEIKRRLLER